MEHDKNHGTKGGVARPGGASLGGDEGERYNEHVSKQVLRRLRMDVARLG
jgi:hypothetical protein